MEVGVWGCEEVRVCRGDGVRACGGASEKVSV